MKKNIVSLKHLPFLIILFLTCVLTFTIKHGHIYDNKDRQIFFHGMNIAVKVAPFLPKTDAYDEHMSFAKEDIAKLKQNGFNAIRLGIMWQGLEPTKDKYNDTYLQELSKIVNMAGEAGIYTLLEFHQKALSRSFCGIGLPPWLIHEDNRYKTFPYPIEKQKYPISDQWIPDRAHCHRHNTSVYYYSYDCAQGFNQLYDEKSYLNQQFSKAWQRVAQQFKGNKYVIAYDLLNQPWVGNQIRNPFLLIPGVAQKCKLQKFYDRLSESIRSIDDNTPICFEPSVVSMKIGATFSHVPGGANYKDKSILCYSYGKWNEKSLGYKYADARRLGVPALVSQMYAVTWPVDRAEMYGMGWFFFYYKDFGCNKSRELYENDEEDMFKEEKLELLSGKEDVKDICPVLIRTFLERVAGCYLYSQFDRDSGRFIAAYEAEPNGETILYLNKEHTYGNKYSIEASPKDQVQIIESKQEASKNYVTLKFNGKQRTEVIINVVKKE